MRQGKKGPRPHTWKVKDPVGHAQHVAWHKQRAQAHYRGEQWDLPFEVFQEMWGDLWCQRGRLAHELCMVRSDPEIGWIRENVTIMNRREHIQIETRRPRKTSLK